MKFQNPSFKICPYFFKVGGITIFHQSSKNTPASIMKHFQANKNISCLVLMSSLQMAWLPLCRITNGLTEPENNYSSLSGKFALAVEFT